MKMAKLNIPSDLHTDDPYYRYKMSRPILSSCKRGKVIDNLDMIAKQLHVDGSILSRWIGCKLNVSINYKNGRLEMSTDNVTDSDIISYIDLFIYKFVLCKREGCEMPELQFKITEKNIKCKCDACGYSYDLGSKCIDKCDNKVHKEMLSLYKKKAKKTKKDTEKI